MRFFQIRQNRSLASSGFVATLVAVVWCASCGSTKGGRSLTGNQDTDAGGDDGSTCSGFSCSGSSSGGGDDSGFASQDSGVIMVGTVNGPVSDTSCPGNGITAANVTALAAGGSNAASLKWLYPYDQTIFPGGLGAPELQWSQTGAPDMIYVHLKSQKYEYTGCFKGPNPQVVLPELEWATAYAQSGGQADPLTVQVTTSTGGKVSGPITETWTFAIGSLKGSLYYNTYTSAIAGNNGAVMLLKPGQSQPTALLAIAGAVPFGPCISCHSLSADGSMLVAQRHFYPGGLQAPGSMSFNLTKGLPNAANPTPLASNAMDDWGFSAVYPDGSRLLTAGESADSTSVTKLFPVANVNNPGMIGPKANVMYNPTTGATITFTGLSDQHAMMPMFSPDGKKIVFNDVDNHGGHALVVQDFDPTMNVFSNPVVIYNDAKSYPGWPFFTPDSKNVVFAMGPSSNFASIPPASFSSVGPVQATAMDVASSDLYMVRLATPGTAQSLDLINGMRNGASYMPFPGRDEHLNFYPTGSPVAAGGYFWVFFTSRRQYGNVMVDTTNMNAVPDPVFHSETKKIWAAAVSIDTATGDPSHPPFMFPGQELTSGNIRAFSVLSPCQGSGSNCESGIDCCTGSCVTGKCGVPQTCAGEGDRCTDAVKCCNPVDQCIGGYCSFIVK
jgi:hypothetical protein